MPVAQACLADGRAAAGLVIGNPPRHSRLYEQTLLPKVTARRLSAALPFDSPGIGEGSVRAVIVPLFSQLHPRRNVTTPKTPGAKVCGNEKTSLRTVPSDRTADMPMRNPVAVCVPLLMNWTTTLSCAASAVVSTVIDVMAMSGSSAGCCGRSSFFRLFLRRLLASPSAERKRLNPP